MHALKNQGAFMKSFNKFNWVLFLDFGLSASAVAGGVATDGNCEKSHVGSESAGACAGDKLDSSVVVPEKKKTTLGLYMTADQAYARVAKNGEKALFVDVRTSEEINFLGMPALVDANIPYMQIPEWKSWDEKSHSLKLETNPDFSSRVAQWLDKKGLNKSDMVILICRSGDRSAKAVNLLANLGYTKVYSVLDGFEGDMADAGPEKGRRAVNGWKNAKLPWSYGLDLNKVN
jgi:rhodanese-related sulfurtransferase